MRKLSVLVCALSSAVPGLTDLAVTPDTVRIGDTITVTGVCPEPGASATVFTFLDRNADGEYDESIDLLEYGPDHGAEVIDGGWSTDTVEDGLINGFLYTTETPWRTVGTHVNILTDHTGSDTAAVVVLMDTSEVWCSGTVRGPDGPLAGVVVSLWVEYESDGETVEYEVDVVSDTNGHFLIYLPEEVAGSDTEIELLAEDRFNKTPWDLLAPGPNGFGAPEPGSPKTGVDMVFIQAPYTIVGQVLDEHDSPAGELRLVLTGDGGMDIFVAVDEDGGFVTAAPEGVLEFELDQDQETDFLFQSMDLEIAGDRDTIEVTCRVHSTDMVISGRIVDTYDLDIDFDWAPVVVETMGDQQWSGVAYAEADGSFSVPVSSAVGPYAVCIDEEEGLPEDYSFSAYCIGEIEAGTEDVEFSVVHEDEQSSAGPVSAKRRSEARILNTPHGLIVRLNGEQAGIDGISLFDMHGRIVGVWKDDGMRQPIDKISLNTLMLAGGRYVLRVDANTAQGQVTRTERFIVGR